MVHLSNETLSELLDGASGSGTQEHMDACPRCRGELEALRRLRTELRELPPLDAPPELWSQIETRLPAVRARRRLAWPSQVALQAVGAAAVFVLGLALGRAFQTGESESEVAQPAAGVVGAEQPAAPASLPDAMAEVRRLAAEYDLALMNLQRLAGQEGAPAPSSLARQRLANLEALVEASRAALATDPADPVLNSYLFAALEEREAMVRQLSSARGSGSGVLWR
ncbi:MAG: hypothetical protein JSV86_17820 [Gemmatimonadota bacterium]|nr:MAG: hypothetical protein JSV86_17820 [Gemmatimonadota bacterium]